MMMTMMMTMTMMMMIINGDGGDGDDECTFIEVAHGTVPRKSWVSENLSPILESWQRFYWVTEAHFFSCLVQKSLESRAQIFKQGWVSASLGFYHSPPLHLIIFMVFAQYEWINYYCIITTVVIHTVTLFFSSYCSCFELVDSVGPKLFPLESSCNRKTLRSLETWVEQWPATFFTRVLILL